MTGKWLARSLPWSEPSSETKEITPMTQAIRSWRQSRRFRAMVCELKALSPRELSALGIRETEIAHLAFEASRI
jgi:uncharacterized protein YjiS (DUF1127 family)